MGLSKQITWIFLLLLVSFQLQADDKNITVSLWASHYSFDSDFLISDDEVFGGSFGINFNQNWTSELVYEAGEMKGLHMDTFHFDALYHFSPVSSDIRPYLVAGIGQQSFSTRGSGSDHETQINAGAGLKFRFSDKWHLRTDIRGFHGMQNNNDDMAVSLILGYSFGASKPAYAKSETPAPQPQKPKDSDRDGVIDPHDNCPNTPFGIKVDSRGCPLDSDKDGVPDYKDDCPKTPSYAKVDSRGCPKTLKETVTLNLNIEFDYDSSQVKPEYNNELKKVADFMATYKNTRTTLEGHTDSRGSNKYNQKLSDRRANAVKDALVKCFNIDSSRLEAIGYGEEKPIASNDTAQGRQENRRVVAVFRVIVEEIEKR